ncbi:DUF4124 domain-containing protein, partial [Myxococcota bacterium]|nr:DUF4124 domain-containing protein [Myxococcota bacterium]
MLAGLLTLSGLLILAPSPEMRRYIDAQGRVHYTRDPRRLPDPRVQPPSPPPSLKKRARRATHRGPRSPKGKAKPIKESLSGGVKLKGKADPKGTPPPKERQNTPIEPKDAKPEPKDAKPEPKDAKPEPKDAKPEPKDAKPEPKD